MTADSTIIIKTITSADTTHIQENLRQIFNASDPEFQALYIPVIIWMILLIIFFYFLLRRYTFKDWKDKENPYKGETFAMPRGIIRGTITISLLFFVLLFETLVLIVPELEANSAHLFNAFEMMIAFYFGSKVMHHLSATEKRKNKDIADTIKEKEKIKAGVKIAENPEAKG
ncbi:MAG: hypothetical protein U9R32_09970 [Bacteroidota bacterium]|nr:hypothetical protein [Bacteroidota bacterium]